MKRLFLLVALLPSLAWAGDNDDWGVWLNLNADKSLTRNLEVGLDGDLCTMDNCAKMDRWDVGAHLGYKAHKYLKLSAGYSFLHDCNPDNTSWSITGTHISDKTVETFTKDIIKEHWSSRHRFYAEASSSVKPCNWLKVSGRLRYQYTYTPAITVDHYGYGEKMEYSGKKFTGEYDANNAPIFTYDTYSSEVTRDGWDKQEKESLNRQVLRTRIMLELDKTDLAWTPFASVELHNNLASSMHFDKLRTAVGTNYKINEHNTVGLSYVYTLNRMDRLQYSGPRDRQNFHAISASYNLSF